MRHFAPISLLSLVLLALLPLAPAGTSAAADTVPAPPLAERYRAVLHGGFARAANTVMTCGDVMVDDAVPCADAQAGQAAASGQYAMTYVDTDDDPNTYDSSAAELRLPAGARVDYARIYWSANISVGEEKAPADNPRILLAEPGGRYREILADDTAGDVTAEDGSLYTASADITELVRYAGGRGPWTVGQVNAAAGNSPAGGWGGWTIVAAFEHPDEPLRELVLWDGLATAGRGSPVELTATGLDVPAGAEGRLGLVAGGGERVPDGADGGDRVTVSAPGAPPTVLHDAANPGTDVLNGTVADLGRATAGRDPAHAHTLGYDSDVLDLTGALEPGADRLSVAFGGGRDAYHLSAVFLQTAARQ
ncbi:DUF3344 domain-containing protein [Streptomyces sp. RFCAC02]|uniref:DUF3344 domain-containing protein n=1 Tax=Streptomyces sp. RFCAC02 TaxID=2499143 RepID=UPI001F118953|nr:DUF3344 domain-containing protein [Streptomyces sp. RFCAC02]